MNKMSANQDVFSDKNNYGDKFTNSQAHNNTASVIHQDDILADINRQKTGNSEVHLDEPVLKNIMGYGNESPIDNDNLFFGQNKDGSLPSNSPLNYNF